MEIPCINKVILSYASSEGEFFNAKIDVIWDSKQPNKQTKRKKLKLSGI